MWQYQWHKFLTATVTYWEINDLVVWPPAAGLHKSTVLYRVLQGWYPWHRTASKRGISPEEKIKTIVGNLLRNGADPAIRASNSRSCLHGIMDIDLPIDFAFTLQFKAKHLNNHYMFYSKMVDLISWLMKRDRRFDPKATAYIDSKQIRREDRGIMSVLEMAYLSCYEIFPAESGSLRRIRYCWWPIWTAAIGRAGLDLQQLVEEIEASGCRTSGFTWCKLRPSCISNQGWLGLALDRWLST